MAIKIDKKIVGYQVQSTGGAADEPAEKAPARGAQPVRGERAPAGQKTAEVIQMHERLERPETLLGSTYKIKTPLSDHALYVTINDIVLNPGTEHEQRRPFEVFINSKNMEHFQWIVALTRIISAVFRKGGDVTFLVEELRSVFDPRGGYFKKGGKYMPSLVAELGDAIDSHLRTIGLITSEPMDESRQRFIAEKRAEADAVHGADAGAESTAFPEYAEFCQQCHAKAVIQADGCMTCLNCGESKCG
ncbi:MAG: NrdJb [Gammaproteobacteria bacterium]|nr:NrdJb [Gammaproteobacteria bacterium]